MSNAFRWGLFMAFTLSTVFSLQTAHANDRCSIPSNLNTWDYYSESHIRKGRDWKSNESTDYWKLVYSWSPAFCKSRGNGAKKLTQCRQDFGLIVHGLWAQKAGTSNIRRHPRNCVDAPAVPKHILKENFCLMPDVKLMQKEWEKHGTCDFKTPDEYFNAIQLLNKKIRMPDKHTVRSLESKSARALSQWLVDNNKGTGLSFEHIDVRKSGRQLKEISLCFDKQFELRSCSAKASFKKSFSQTHDRDNDRHNSQREPKKDWQKKDNRDDSRQYSAKQPSTHSSKPFDRDEPQADDAPDEQAKLPLWKNLLLVIVNALLGVINS